MPNICESILRSLFVFVQQEIRESGSTGNFLGLATGNIAFDNGRVLYRAGESADFFTVILQASLALPLIF
jgi:hypothetical protein